MKDDFSDWEDMMKSLGVKKHSSKKAAKSPKKSQQSAVQNGPTKAVSQTSSTTYPKSVTSKSIPQVAESPEPSLEDWLLSEDSKKVAHFEEKIAQLQSENQELQVQNSQHNNRISELEFQIISLEQQIRQRTQDLEDQRIGYTAQIEQMGMIQEKLESQTQQQSAIIAEQNDKLQELSLHATSQQSLLKVAVQRKIMQVSEQMELVRKLTTHPLGFAFLQKALVSTDVQTFLQEEVLLVGSHIQEHNLQGLCISVEPKHCEISQGHPIQDDIREMVTEILLQGWRSFYILGLDKRVVPFVRRSLGNPSIDIQVDIRGDSWLESADVVALGKELDKYPAVIIFGKIQPPTSAIVFQYSDASIGESFAKIREDIANYSTED